MSKFMKYSSMLIALFVISLGLSGCGGAKLSPNVQKAFSNKQTMYTQQNMHFMLGGFAQRTVNTANYAQGFLIPVNSKVTFKDINSRQFSFIHKGTTIIMKNVPKYTGVTTSELVDRHFSTKKVNLGKFTAKEKAVILKPEGAKTPLRAIPRPFGVSYVGGYGLSKVTKGMSKESVLVARGYPPVHGTPNTMSNSWKYWESAGDTITINFKNNKVTSVVR